MQIDLTSLSAGQIAVLTATVTLVAATLGGAFALVVALVNAWSAARLGRASHQREFRRALFEPFITHLSHELWRLSSIAASLRDAETNCTNARHAVQNVPYSERSQMLATVFGHLKPSGKSGKALAVYKERLEAMDRAALALHRLLESQEKEHGPEKVRTVPGAIARLDEVTELIDLSVAAGFELRLKLDKHVFE